MAQNRVVARRHANALQEPFAWPTSDAVAKQMNELRHPTSAARKRRGDFRNLLDKRPPAASFVTDISSVAFEASLSPPRLAQANLEGDARASRAGSLKDSSNRDRSQIAHGAPI
jgi:hypothetical protein